MALPAGQPVTYLAPGATGAGDVAWSQRVAEHRNRRPAHWSTVETDDIATQLRQLPETPLLVDDLGSWLTATLDRNDAWDQDTTRGADSPTSWALSTSASPSCVIGWCWWWPDRRCRSSRRGRDGFPPSVAARCGRRRSRARPPGHADQAEGRAGATRGSVGMDRFLPKRMPAKTIRAHAGGGVRR